MKWWQKVPVVNHAARTILVGLVRKGQGGPRFTASRHQTSPETPTITLRTLHVYSLIRSNQAGERFSGKLLNSLFALRNMRLWGRVGKSAHSVALRRSANSTEIPRVVLVQTKRTKVDALPVVSWVASSIIEATSSMNATNFPDWCSRHRCCRRMGPSESSKNVSSLVPTAIRQRGAYSRLRNP